MRKFRCITCKHEFENDEKKPSALKCPKCLSRFVELIDGAVLKGKAWGSKSFSVK